MLLLLYIILKCLCYKQGPSSFKGVGIYWAGRVDWSDNNTIKLHYGQRRIKLMKSLILRTELISGYSRFCQFNFSKSLELFGSVSLNPCNVPLNP